MDAFWKAANSNVPTTVDEKGRRLVDHPRPTNPMVSPLLTDLYQFTMAYAYWKAGKHHDRADGFFDYLRALDCSDVDVYAISEGFTVFPNVPLMRVEGPVAVVQLLETPFLNLVNYASLVTTNAARHRFVVGKSKALLEFGFRRAQGPDGGISASRYCYMGGFDATRFIIIIVLWFRRLEKECIIVVASKLQRW
ncbi:hypothetical protein M5K25_006855 [Dendrobium thyrsiflorum]|uniref:nicotinate phosphoribosyltransferase n=1 Tax=Dendrobium thyrsiflorum TaxID=117978 RepID=A0ABD0VCN7_DENTH